MKRRLRIACGLLALGALAPAQAAEELGRLFFTPEKRAALERQRAQNVQEAQTLRGTSMTLDGVVQRSSGKGTVWINQQAQNEGESERTGVTAVITRGAPGSALLAPGEEAPARLKVGEAINRATGERDSRLGGGKVVTPATKSH